MEKLTTLTGVGVPLRRSNVDTDQIIPAVFLKRVTKSGFDDALFYAWRRDPNFVLNKPEYAGKGQILVAGPEFGIGSSREHAPIAIKATGISCVIAHSFARIFYRNGINNGMLLIETDDLYDRCEEGDLLTVEVNRCLKVNGQVIPIRQIPDNLFEIIKAGGLVPRYRALNEAAEAAESVQKEVH